jgi:hypothetical protein
MIPFEVWIEAQDRQNARVGGPDIDMMKAVAGEITSIDNAVIQGIINRIPSTYLPRAVADNIIQTLLSRRAAVRALWP